MTEFPGLVQQVRDRRDLPTPEMRRALRKAAGLSLEDVAQQLGVTRQTVSRWELAERAPRGARLPAYVALLRVLQEETA